MQADYGNSPSPNGSPSTGELGRRMDRFERTVNIQFSQQNKVLGDLSTKLDRMAIDLVTLRTEVKDDKIYQATRDAENEKRANHRREIWMGLVGFFICIISAVLSGVVIHFL